MFYKPTILSTFFAALISTTFSIEALEIQDVKGVYTNPEGFVKSFGFCGNGTGAVGSDGFMVRRSYIVKDDLIYVYSNGTFTFKLEKETKKLIPVDAFTKEWAAETPYLIDVETEISCD